MHEPWFVGGDPVHGGQASNRPLVSSSNGLLLDQHQQPGEDALQDVQDVRYGLHGVTHCRESSAVEDHLPLHLALGGEECGGMEGKHELHRGRAGHPAGGTERRSAFDAEEHARIGLLLSPAVVLDELIFQTKKPGLGTRVQRSKGVGACERDSGATSPVVHVADICGEDELRGSACHGEDVWRAGTSK